MRIVRSRWFKIGATVVFAAYLVTAFFGVPGVHRQILREIAEYNEKMPQVSATANFRYTFPCLPGLVLSRWDVYKAGVPWEGYRDFYYVTFFNAPRLVRRTILSYED
jgi:hypothetical protein